MLLGMVRVHTWNQEMVQCFTHLLPQPHLRIIMTIIGVIIIQDLDFQLE